MKFVQNDATQIKSVPTLIFDNTKPFCILNELTETLKAKISCYTDAVEEM